MAIVHKLLPDGGFVAGDTETRVTAYSFPTSHWATNARRHAAITAAAMLDIEAVSRKWTPASISSSYDARNWARLEETAPPPTMRTILFDEDGAHDLGSLGVGEIHGVVGRAIGEEDNH